MSVCRSVFRTPGSNAGVLVACYHYPSRGYLNLCGSLDGPIAAIRWGRRLLFLTLFISCMVVLNLWHLPTTIPFLGAVIALTVTGLCVVKEDDETAVSAGDMNT